MASPRHFNIVALETFFCPLPPLTVPSPHTFTLTEYTRTAAHETAERIRDADIIITTTLRLDASVLSSTTCPNLKFIAVMASGTDSIDLDACKERGIRVVNSPECNVTAVAEHALGLYFAARRSIVPSMRHLGAGQWPQRGTLMTTTYAAGKPPRGCGSETAVIYGHGAVGRAVQALFEALGMTVLIAARKGTPPTDGRVAFEESLKVATVMVVCCPRTPETLNLLSGPELALVRDDAVLVNVARGGIVDESALLKALQENQLAGAAVDVFATEPASPETSPLLGPEAAHVNLVTTPHTAWIGMDTATNYRRVLQENIDGFIMDRLEKNRVKA
ncbi:hypothetical protein PFICI_00937 [Pestalotiopsis fici W106-1]|uniref:Glycerate dehydrogenase n=1 Tax=Pestalotiopsis fici (strain W106-1 / CGMCC3.15140) TaxID=1229662 RepID=W3XM89_PESFW|nr:uncharacterized protein PFICI_00937 [Pestalotiopsis fici W106-1]ETS87109.1 hypothetical protein PFICI_00937 [Pestalotiopsis fici W106-1]